MKLPDEVSLIKEGNLIKKHIPADVQPEMIFIDDHKLPLEEGDILRRILPNGLHENYKVIDRGYFSNNAGGEYQAKVRKTTILSNEPEKTIYNIHGNNSRVNINSKDSSINIVDKSSNEFFTDLKSTIEKELSGKEKELLLRKIEELERTKNTNSFPKKYAEFMSAAANHATILSSFFPALIQFFGH